MLFAYCCIYGTDYICDTTKSRTVAGGPVRRSREKYSIITDSVISRYNIEYINDMVVALLELIYRVLQIVAQLQNTSSSSN